MEVVNFAPLATLPSGEIAERSHGTEIWSGLISDLDALGCKVPSSTSGAEACFLDRTARTDLCETVKLIVRCGDEFCDC
jgi:hypothetical protein